MLCGNELVLKVRVLLSAYDISHRQVSCISLQDPYFYVYWPVPFVIISTDVKLIKDLCCSECQDRINLTTKMFHNLSTL